MRLESLVEITVTDRGFDARVTTTDAANPATERLVSHAFGRTRASLLRVTRSIMARHQATLRAEAQ